MKGLIAAIAELTTAIQRLNDANERRHQEQLQQAKEFHQEHQFAMGQTAAIMAGY